MYIVVGKTLKKYISAFGSNGSNRRSITGLIRLVIQGNIDAAEKSN